MEPAGTPNHDASMKRFARDMAVVRKRSGLSLDEMHESTRISRRILEEFEENGLVDNELFNRVYLRSFIMTYARTVGYDQNRALAGLESALQGNYSAHEKFPADAGKVTGDRGEGSEAREAAGKRAERKAADPTGSKADAEDRDAEDGDAGDGDTEDGKTGATAGEPDSTSARHDSGTGNALDADPPGTGDRASGVIREDASKAKSRRNADTAGRKDVDVDVSTAEDKVDTKASEDVDAAKRDGQNAENGRPSQARTDAPKDIASPAKSGEVLPKSGEVLPKSDEVLPTSDEMVPTSDVRRSYQQPWIARRFRFEPIRPESPRRPPAKRSDESSKSSTRKFGSPALISTAVHDYHEPPPQKGLIISPSRVKAAVLIFLVVAITVSAGILTLRLSMSDVSQNTSASSTPPTARQGGGPPAVHGLSPEQAPLSAPVLAVGDTILVTVAASGEPLDPIRVQVDDDLRRPYWIDSGDSLSFAMTDRIVLDTLLERATVKLEGVPYQPDSYRSLERLVITRDSVLHFAESLRRR